MGVSPRRMFADIAVVYLAIGIGLMLLGFPVLWSMQGLLPIRQQIVLIGAQLGVNALLWATLLTGLRIAVRRDRHVSLRWTFAMVAASWFLVSMIAFDIWYLRGQSSYWDGPPSIDWLAHEWPTIFSAPIGLPVAMAAYNTVGVPWANWTSVGYEGPAIGLAMTVGSAANSLLWAALLTAALAVVRHYRCPVTQRPPRPLPPAADSG